MKLKNYKLDKKSFIQGWFIPKNICNDIIDYYNLNKNLVTRGSVSYGGKQSVDFSYKDSFDIGIDPNTSHPILNKYGDYLQACLNNYINIYKNIEEYAYFKICEPINIQHYPPGGGFKKWHFESNNKESSKRILVFMTYLNTVKNAGTEFYYQNIKTDCLTGLTLIWPSNFTHQHKGVINKTKDKFIITGWFSYI